MSNELGTYKIECIRPGGYTLTNYGQYSFSENEEIDLMDQNLPDTIRCGSWWTARTMCTDMGYEIAQLIASGDFIVTEATMPVVSESDPEV